MRSAAPPLRHQFPKLDDQSLTLHQITPGPCCSQARIRSNHNKLDLQQKDIVTCPLPQSPPAKAAGQPPAPRPAPSRAQAHLPFGRQRVPVPGTVFGELHKDVKTCATAKAPFRPRVVVPLIDFSGNKKDPNNPPATSAPVVACPPKKETKQGKPEKGESDSTVTASDVIC